MVSHHVHGYFFKDAIEAGTLSLLDRELILSELVSLPLRNKMVVEDYKNNYQKVIFCHCVADLKAALQSLEDTRNKLHQINTLLERFHINPRLWFDEYDLIGSVKFIDTLFDYFPEKKCLYIIKNRAGERYPHTRYLGGLPTKDRDHLVAMLKTITDRDRIIVKDCDYGYENIIACGIVKDMRGVHDEIDRIRILFHLFNREMDRLRVTPEMRFDENDLCSAIEFHRFLFTAISTTARPMNFLYSAPPRTSAINFAAPCRAARPTPSASDFVPCTPS